MGETTGGTQSGLRTAKEPKEKRIQIWSRSQKTQQMLLGFARATALRLPGATLQQEPSSHQGYGEKLWPDCHTNAGYFIKLKKEQDGSLRA